MAPIPSTLMSSGSKKKEPKYVYLSEAKASHSHRMWTEVSSSVPHFLQMVLLLSPIICRCLLKVLCPVSRPITTLACVLLKDSNRVHVTRLGPKINSRRWRWTETTVQVTSEVQAVDPQQANRKLYTSYKIRGQIKLTVGH